MYFIQLTTLVTGHYCVSVGHRWDTGGTQVSDTGETQESDTGETQVGHRWDTSETQVRHRWVIQVRH